jgi:hypothetical protein
MKSSLIPIACGTALALMSGAAATHWCAVRDMVALAHQMPSGPRYDAPPPYPAPSPLPDDRVAREAKDLLAEARGTKNSPTARAGTQPFYMGDVGRSEAEPAPRPSRPAASSSSDPTEARIEKLLTALEGAVEQNQELRDRLADTNRDVMELRFQVDSYHGQFRPLKVEEEPTYYDDASGGVLPPLEAP